MVKEPRIIFEDNKILVVEKPQGMPTQEDDSKDLDLLSFLKQYIKQRDSKPGNVFLGLVHRLDRPVGGVMVFAKNSKAAANLTNQVQSKTFQKTYLAVVENSRIQDESILTHYLSKDENSNTVSVFDTPVEGAKEAILKFKTLERVNNLALLEIQLITGRAHQIRAQLSHIGHPIWGDKKYGAKNHNFDIALWSHRLVLEHPKDKKMMEFISKVPQKEPWNRFRT